MSLLKSNSVQIGQSATATQNFTLSVPASPDGTIKLARGNSGATTADILSVSSSGAVTINNLNNQSFRNRIINGDMRIWQRGTTISNPISTSFYTADRMGVNRGGDVGGAVVSRIASGLAGFEYALALQRIAGDTSVQPISLYYSNESTNTYDLVGSPVTLSFYAKTGANYSGSVFSFHIYSGTGTDQRVYNYTGQVSVASASQAITATWTRFTLTGTVPANSTELGLQIVWTPTGTAGADDAVKITGVQLEAGSTATDFERRPIGTELALCQRYYSKSYEDGTAPGSATTLGLVFAGKLSASSYGYCSVNYDVKMRGVPTINFWDGNGNASKFSYLTEAGATTTFTHNINPGSSPFNISSRSFCIVTSADIVNSSFLHFQASAEL